MSALRALRRERLADPTPCGSLWIALNGTECALRCSGALWLPAERVLVAADLHLEKGSAYAARGQLLPPYDTADTLARLEAEVGLLDPRTVILLGDSFHDARALGRLAPEHSLRLAALALGRTLVWAEGNHDVALLAERGGRLPGEVAGEVRLASLVLRHEPQPGRRRARSPATCTPASSSPAAAQASAAEPSSPTANACSSPPSAPTPAASTPATPPSPRSSPGRRCARRWATAGCIRYLGGRWGEGAAG